MTENTSPIVCIEDAFSPAQKARHDELFVPFMQEKLEVKELESGYAIRYPYSLELFANMAELAALERMCCPFFDLKLDVAADADSFWFSMTGPEGVKGLMVSEMNLRMPVA